jgi:hypothetical protein
VPFFLAVGRHGAASPAPAVAVELRRLQAALAGELRRLDAACWQGRLGAPELRRFQEIRAAIRRVNQALDPEDPGALA